MKDKNKNKKGMKNPDKKDYKRYKGNETEDGYIIRDNKNPDAWVKSTDSVHPEKKA